MDTSNVLLSITIFDSNDLTHTQYALHYFQDLYYFHEHHSPIYKLHWTRPTNQDFLMARKTYSFLSLNRWSSLATPLLAHNYLNTHLCLETSLASEWSINSWYATRSRRELAANTLRQAWELSLLARKNKTCTSLGTTQTSLTILLVETRHECLS